jgi:hypothetical protein
MTAILRKARPFINRATRNTLACACLVFTLAAGAQAAPAELPPLHEPPTGHIYPGKFVWADLFSADVDAAVDFYSKLFGWTATAYGTNAHRYVVMANDGRPVAGVAARPRGAGEQGKARWIGYVSVLNADNAVSAATAAGGRLMVEPRNIARRGTHAIVADNQGALVGMLASSSGDAEDFRADVGDWIWAQLLTDQPDKAVQFYQSVFGYTGMPDIRGKGGDDYLLVSQGYARAGISHLPAATQAKPTWIGFVRVTDLAETLARVQSLGGRILRAPALELFDGKLAIIADPLGGVVGLVALKDSDFPGDTP